MARSGVIVVIEARKSNSVDVDPRIACADEQSSKWGLHDATPGCDGRIIDAPGGGVRCNKCSGWFCF